MEKSLYIATVFIRRPSESGKPEIEEMHCYIWASTMISACETLRRNLNTDYSIRSIKLIDKNECKLTEQKDVKDTMSSNH